MLSAHWVQAGVKNLLSIGFRDKNTGGQLKGSHLFAIKPILS
jgi:hypothetical protein